jgi:hypothetical protein
MKVRECLLYEGGTTPAEKAVECVTLVDGPTMPDDRSGHVGPAHGATSRLVEHAIERQVHAEALEMLYHLLCSAHSIGATALEKGIQLGRVRRKKIPQDVHLAPGRSRGELTSTNHPDTMLFAGG